MSSRLVCLNPNPSIDRTLILDELVLGGVNRVAKSSEVAGGKGAIVTRTAQNLGHDAVCCGPLGGRVGQTVREMAEAEGLTAAWVPVSGQTRVNTTIVSSGPVDTVVNEAGPVLSAEEWDAYCKLASELAGDDGVACISGSLPQGVDDNQARSLVEALLDRNCKVFVDSHGAALTAMAKARPWCIKVNHLEAAAFVGSPADQQGDITATVVELANHVTGVAIITLGGDGAVCATPDGYVVQVRPAPIDATSAVGSGDAFLAGLASATLTGRSLDEALVRATACGAANAQSGLQGSVELSNVEALMGAVKLTVLQEAEPT